MRIVDVRWNSTQACFASILRIWSAFGLVQAKYSTDPDFPNDIRIDDLFIEDMVQAEETIRPLVYASLLMQRDNNTLGDVVNMFGCLYCSFKTLSEMSHRECLIEKLEKRWKKQEQPYLFLCWMLHPKYVSSFREIVLSGMIGFLSAGCMIEPF